MLRSELSETSSLYLILISTGTRKDPYDISNVMQLWSHFYLLKRFDILRPLFLSSCEAVQSAKSLAVTESVLTSVLCVRVNVYCFCVVFAFGVVYFKNDAMQIGISSTLNCTFNISRLTWNICVPGCVCALTIGSQIHLLLSSSKRIESPFCSCRYSIDRHTDLERLFNIDSVNGTITTLKALDREMSKWHNISVVATEISNFPAKTSVFKEKKDSHYSWLVTDVGILNVDPYSYSFR